MILLPSHDSDHKFGRSTRVNSSWFFVSYFNWLFFNFIFQHRVDWELSFVIYFNFLSIGLSQSHYLGCKFNRLTRVDLIYFFSFQFHHSTLSLLEVKLQKFILIFFSWNYHSLIIRHADWQVNSCWPESIQYVVISIVIRKHHLKCLFWVKLCFYRLFELPFNLSNQLGHIRSISTWFNFFLLEKTLATPRYFFMIKKNFWSNSHRNANQ
jgi:hypothetical protein